MHIPITPQTTVHFEAAGQGSPVVLLHAFPLSSQMWRPQLEALGEEFRVLAPDQRGFGRTSNFDGEPSIETMADDLDRLLTALEIDEPIVLGGLSMGGYAALQFVRKYPRRLRGLILADTRAEPDTPEGRDKRDEMIAFADANGPAAVVQKMLPALTGETTRRTRPAVVEEVVGIGSTQSLQGVTNGLRALRDRHDADAWLPAISVPTLVLVGEEDTITPLTMARHLQDFIPGAHLEVIPEAGHLSNLENPEFFNDAVLRFLATID